MRKPTFCICENKDADQLRGNREADQRLCFRYRDSAIPLLSKSGIFKPLAIFCGCAARFVSDQVGNRNVGFLMTRLICHRKYPSNALYIMITRPCDLSPLESHFYIHPGKPVMLNSEVRGNRRYTIEIRLDKGQYYLTFSGI